MNKRKRKKNGRKVKVLEAISFSNVRPVAMGTHEGTHQNDGDSFSLKFRSIVHNSNQVDEVASRILNDASYVTNVDKERLPNISRVKSQYERIEEDVLLDSRVSGFTTRGDRLLSNSAILNPSYTDIAMSRIRESILSGGNIQNLERTRSSSVDIRTGEALHHYRNSRNLRKEMIVGNNTIQDYIDTWVYGVKNEEIPDQPKSNYEFMTDEYIKSQLPNVSMAIPELHHTADFLYIKVKYYKKYKNLKGGN